MEHTNIQNFYKNKTIFITGSTGFVGKVLVEKLLRSCSELNKIILTIRPKKKSSVEERILEYFNDALFDSIKNDKPDILNKVLFVTSNLEDKHCGLNDEEYNLVKSSNIIFHCAASIEFSAPLKEAIRSNIIATKNIIGIAKDMDNLQALIYVSTCWVHGSLKETKEEVINLTYKPEFFISLVHNTDEEFLEKITPALLKYWPNTYLLTKHVAEYLIYREKGNLPVAVFRLPGVSSTYREPFPGWMNSIQALTILGIGLATGTLKVIYSDSNYRMDIVPVDMIANCLIAVAWNTALQNSGTEVKVYNYSCISNPVLRKTYCDTFTNTPYPLEWTVWTPGYVTTSNKWLFDKYIAMYHTYPAIICDTFLKMLGQKPFYEKMLARYTKLSIIAKDFLSRDFKFNFNNVPALWNSLPADDQKLFNFDVNSINWDDYLNVSTKSLKIFLKEDMNNLEKCQERRYLVRCKY